MILGYLVLEIILKSL